MDAEKSLEAVRQLKSAFGARHHLLTQPASIPFNVSLAADFGSAGLDEFDFIFADGTLNKYLPVIEAC